MMKRDHIIVHHTGAEEKNAAQVKRYHLSLGWRGVGYNYIIERDGMLVIGRSLDIPGAHCRAGDMNRRGVGVSLIGNLDNHPPTRRQVDVLPVLLRELMALHDIPAQRVLGHREVPGAATACPGRYLDMHALRRKLVVVRDTPETGSPVLKEDRAVLVNNSETTEDTVYPAFTSGTDGFLISSEPPPGYTLPEPIGPVVWRVLAGIFRTQKEAENRVRQLRALDIDAVVIQSRLGCQ